MAQLPPKVPNWPSSFPNHHHHHQRLPPVMAGTLIPPSAAAAAQPPSWIDEFLDFSSARRGAHRRSSSDSIAFLEAAPPLLAEECDQNSNGFDRLDDEQLMSMFSDDISLAGLPPPSNPSTPSDQNSNNEEKAMALDQQQQQQPKNEPGEEESSCMLEPQATRSYGAGDTAIDPKRVKRILANRQSAQRSRVRKLQYISELERSVTSLQGEVSALSPRVAFLDHQRLILNVDNSALKQRIAALAQDRIFKDAHQEALKKEIERLRQVYHQQNLKKMNNNNNAPQPQPPQQSLTPAAGNCTDKEQLLN